MKKSRASHIKQAQRESFLHSQLASFFLTIAQDDQHLLPLSVSRISLSDKRSVCTVFFTALGGKTVFDEKLPQLLLYKPTMRKALSQVMHSRYCPDLMFKYDEMLEEVYKLETLFNSLKKI